MSKLFNISKIRFFEYGKPAPEGSRFKGILDETSLVGYSRYTGDEKKNDRNRELATLHEGGYLGYVNKDEYTFTSEGDGWLRDEDKKEFEKTLASLFNKDGDLWWETIISFSSEEAAMQFGLEEVEDYKMLIDRCMPKICRALKINLNNVLWWANRHVDTTHPHVHLNWIEKDKSRDRGKMTEAELRRVKNIIVTELLHIREESQDIDLEIKNKIFIQKDKAYHELIKAVGNGVLEKNINEIADLHNVLPKTGRLSYNSYVMKPYKKVVDKIIGKILNDCEIQNYLNEYMNMLNRINDYQNQFFSKSGDNDIANIKNAEMEKLYSRIGNMILKDYREKSSREIKSSEKGDMFKFSDSVRNKKYYNDSSMAGSQGIGYIFTINKKLLVSQDDDFIFVMIPRTHCKKYMYLDKKCYEQLNKNTGKYVIETSEVAVYDQHGKMIEKISVDDLMDYWDDKTKINLKKQSRVKDGTSSITRGRKRLSQTNSKINCDTVKQKKAVNDYVKKVRRWMKLRNVYVSGSEQYKELREWERANGIRQI